MDSMDDVNFFMWQLNRLEHPFDHPFFSRSTENAPLCRDWTKGECGECCPLRHYYNESDLVTNEQLQVDDFPVTRVDTEKTEYSSPRVNIIKEVFEQRKEEIDLETGKKRSWTERTEYEVFDLTSDVEESPVLESNNKEEYVPSATNNVNANKNVTVDLIKIKVVDGVCSRRDLASGKEQPTVPCRGSNRNKSSLNKPVPNFANIDTIKNVTVDLMKIKVTDGGSFRRDLSAHKEQSPNQRPTRNRLPVIKYDNTTSAKKVAKRQCPICRRMFKGVPGVRSHRSSSKKCRLTL